MLNPHFCRQGVGIAGSLVALVLGLIPADADSLITRTYSLRAGWNAVYLEVKPTNTVVETVFAGVPIESVWRHKTRDSSVDYIEDPSEPVWNKDQWLVHVPTNRVESLDNNLFRIHGGNAYLIKASAPTNWTVTGVPFFGAVSWKADAFNLKGFPIDDGAPPTFDDFFRWSGAHYDADNSALQPIYRLSAGGAWERVAGTDLMQAGVAYWVFSKGQSSYIAPFEARFDGDGVLDFARTLNERALRLVNKTTSTLTATLEELQAPGATALKYAVFDGSAGTLWPNLPSLLSQNLGGGVVQAVRLAANRANVPGEGYESILDIRDNAGTRFLLPVSVQRLNAVAEGASVGSELEAKRHAGLWAGVISVTGVSEAHSGTLTVAKASLDGAPIEMIRTGVSAQTRPVAAPFDLRVILHVDTTGKTRLLHEVVQMWKDGTYRTNPDGTRTVDVPGKYVLLTDERRLSEFKGATMKDGTGVGRRLSTIGFDFPTTPDANYLELTGFFAVNQQLRGSYVMPAQHPRNPFYHKYHPDHDNLDARFTDVKKEAFDVTRTFELEFQDPDPTGGPRPADYGYARIGGVFRETVQGLHREAIHVVGTFSLKRVAEITELNP